MSKPSNHRPALFLASKRSAPPSAKRRPTSTEFDHEVIKRRIRKAGMDVFRVTPLPDGTGVQYWVVGGGVVNVFNTGTVLLQGKLSDTDLARVERAFRSR